MIAALVLALAGCHEIANPFADDLAPTDTITTPSVAGIESAEASRSLRARAFAKHTMEPADGTVTHWPLWYQDPFEDKGSEDGQFKLTEEDGIAVPYGLARFILNTMALPVSIAVQPPWKVMCSDGRLSRQALGYDHDAVRCAGSVPIDVLEISAIEPSPLAEDGLDAAPPGASISTEPAAPN